MPAFAPWRVSYGLEDGFICEWTGFVLFSHSLLSTHYLVTSSIGIFCHVPSGTIRRSILHIRTLRRKIAVNDLLSAPETSEKCWYHA